MALETQGPMVLGTLPPPYAPQNLPPAQEVTDLGERYSVGIMAYNEEANIAATVQSILGQRLHRGQLAEVIVVASGCTDRTPEIVAEIARNDDRVRLIIQERREGKASGINQFIAAARAPILVMVSADVVVGEGSLDCMARHFADPEVGMVGAHPIPVNDEASLMGHAVHLQWRLHDRLARQSPKLGEMVAFRNVVPNIPMDTAVDEISIQALISQLGYRLIYEPEAIVYNRGPSTVSDFLRQRRRIHAGHLRVREQQGYEPSTMSGWRALRALGGSGSLATPRMAWRTMCAIGLEVTARTLARYDHAMRRSHAIWETAATTKAHIADGAGPILPTVLVFHIANLHRHELQHGARASRQVTERVKQRIQDALGPATIVSVQQTAVIIALLSGTREDAEQAADQLVREEIRVPLNGHGEQVRVQLACGIIAFTQYVNPPTNLVPVPIAEGAGQALPS
jgi:poly-beta-1,6-N-acetyl-D-glucosamine synthase